MQIEDNEQVERSTSNHPPFDITLDESNILFEQLTPVINGNTSRLAIYEKSIKDLPQPPALWNAFQRAINNGESSAKLGNIIKDDPVLSASILRSANAAGLGIRVPIYDVNRAVAHLGTTLVRTIVSRHSFSGNLSHAKDVYDIHKLWKHSMAVSSFSEIIAEHIPGCNSDEASALGLFHDIGKMSINLFTQFIQQAELDPSQGHLHYEHQRLSCTHIDLGVLLAKHWQLPEKVVRGIYHHHHPAHTPAESIPADIRPEVFAVYLADLLAIRLGFDTGHSGIAMPHESYAYLLPKTTLMDIMNSNRINTEIKRIDSIEF